ncbi:MAG: HAD family hydrolase [Anaerolineales bacterium]
MPIDMIAFDADDTLWHNEVYYQNAIETLTQTLAKWETPEKIVDSIDKIEIRNLPLYGYGIKAFILSLIEAAIEISDGEIGGEPITNIIDMGKSMLQAEVALKPGVLNALKTLSNDYRMMVITKGDLLDQTDKVKRSGLQPFFTFIEVVNDKTTPTYRKIIDKYGLHSETFVMVGNSLRSDVLPILDIGASAIYIPSETLWAHEMVPDFELPQKGFYELEHIGQLPDLIATMQM